MELRLKSGFLETAEAEDSILCIMLCGEGNVLDLKEMGQFSCF